MSELRRLPLEGQLKAILSQGGRAREVALYALGECRVVVAREPVDVDGADYRWHMSISHPFRHPSWTEIGVAKDAALPAVWMCVPHVPRQFWLNVHAHCFHLWEFRDEPLRAQFQLEGQVARAAGYGDPS